MSSSLSSEFEIRTILEQDKNQIFEHMHKFFFKEEPLCASFGQLADDDPLLEDMDGLIIEALKMPSQSLVLLHEGKVIGVTINGILERNQPIKMSKNAPKSEKFEHFCTILELVENEANLFGKFPNCNKILLLKLLSVDASYRGKGLAKILIDKCRELARSLNCGVLTLDCTSFYSSKASAKLGFELMYSYPYTNYQANGQVVFRPPPPHDAINVYAQQI